MPKFTEDDLLNIKRLIKLLPELEKIVETNKKPTKNPTSKLEIIQTQTPQSAAPTPPPQPAAGPASS